MKLDEIVTWYQKKIGTYDKQQWEKTVEQNILDGLSRVQLKTAKLKPELIDVDLVRGSTFQKEKPKQSLFTVIRLAICRYFFLPLYAQWWVKQTSSNAFALLLSLYLLQMVNWSVYTLNVRHNEAVNKNHVENTTETNIKETTDDNIIPLFELFIPMCISLLLSLIHSQIVATNSSTSSSKSKHRQYSKTNTNKVSREQRIRRRKKIIRLRSYDSTDTSVQQQQQILDAVIKKDTTDVQNLEYINSSKSETIHKEFEHIPIVQVYPFNKNCDNTKELNSKQSVSTEETKTEIINSSSPKKRNVNWHSTIQKYEVEILEKQQQISPPAMSSSPSPLASYNNSLEPVEIAIQTESKSVSELKVPSALRRNFGEDDGFESLNGKSSSGEENVSLQLMPGVPNTQLRQRTKVNNINNNNLENDVISNVIVNTRSRKTEPSSSEMDEDGDYEMEVSPTPATANCAHLGYNECTTSATEWLGVTTNSEECSYSSEYENSEGFKSEGDPYDTDCNPALLLNCHGVTDRISCTIWEQREVKKAQLSVLQISSCILERVDSMPETNDYVYLGICFAIIISLLPCICRLFESALESMDNVNDVNLFYFPKLIFENTSFTYENILNFAFGNVPWQRIVLIIAYLQRFCLSLLLFIIFAVAERTFKQRFLYAKLFSHLTSSRRARKSNLPHFRLNKVRNIKTWLSVRSYLKKRGPQRSVNVIVTSAFIVTLLLLAFLSVEFLKDSVQVHSQLNLEALLWATFIGIYLLRFMTLGNKIHEKYRSVSVLITEQINLYLQIEQKPKKKEELMVANSVLKLAADLLKELESPFKISGLCANPYLFTTIKVVILSALSGVLSEMLGFKLKLHKIKIK